MVPPNEKDAKTQVTTRYVNGQKKKKGGGNARTIVRTSIYMSGLRLCCLTRMLGASEALHARFSTSR